MRIFSAQPTCSLLWTTSLSLLLIGCGQSSSSRGDADPSVSAADGMPTAGDMPTVGGTTTSESAVPLGGQAADERPTEMTAEIGQTRQTLTHGGLERQYILYVPENYDAATPTPLLFVFHGNGEFIETFINAGDLRAQADREGVIVVYPQGASGSEGQPEWNSYVGEGNKSQTDDFGFVETIVERTSNAYNVDADRVYASGYSNGGFFAHALACFRSDLVAAVASVSGTMMENSIMNCQPTHPTAVIVLHGTADATVPYEGGVVGFSSVADTINYWVGYNELTADEVMPPTTENGRTFEHTTYSGGTNGVTLEHYKIEGGDHVWFDMTFNGATTAEVVWRFLSAYDKNGAR